MDPERGPFRTAEPTVEARQAREREASFERVRERTAEAIAAEQRRERGYDRLAWGALAVSVLALAGLGAALVESQAYLPLACPAFALLVVSTLVVRLRSVARRG